MFFEIKIYMDCKKESCEITTQSIGRKGSSQFAVVSQILDSNLESKHYIVI